MAFNSALDEVDQRVPPYFFVYCLKKLICMYAKVGADGTYSVDCVIVGYKDEYAEWMKAQGISNLNVTIHELGGGCAHRLCFTIRRV